jgi:hypothetical protein
LQDKLTNELERLHTGFSPRIWQKGRQGIWRSGKDNPEQSQTNAFPHAFVSFHIDHSNQRSDQYNRSQQSAQEH